MTRTSVEPEQMKALYPVILDHFQGVIVVVDRHGKILFIQNNGVAQAPEIDDTLIGGSLYGWLNDSFLRHSPTLRTLQTKTVEIDYVALENQTPLVTVASPVFDQEGRLDKVVAFSQEDSMLQGMVSRVINERNRAANLLEYFSKVAARNLPMVAQSPHMRRIMDYVYRIAPSENAVMLYGESGAGKDVLARFIHRNSQRRERIFLPVACGSADPGRLEARLFGYEGTVSGAKGGGAPGLLELADGGTLYLDEIGYLPPNLQRKLMRVLEAGEYMRVGGQTIMHTDVRIICATSRDLQQMVRECRFREDLYYRLNVVPVYIPPMRERKEDIVPLAQAFLKELNQRYNQNKRFSPELLGAMARYHWPGNVRELRNAVELLYTASRREELVLENLDFLKACRGGLQPEGTPEARADLQPSYKEAMRRFEAIYLNAVLEDCGGDVSAAAKRLKISRSGLYKKLGDFRKQSEEKRNGGDGL